MRNIFMSEGNVGQDPTLKHLPVEGGVRSVLEVNVKFNYDKLNKNTGEYEDRGGYWAKVNLWGKRAENNFKFLKTGMRILVIGETSQHDYVSESGERAGQLITSTEINANYIALVLTKGVQGVQFIRGHQEEPEEYDTESN